MQTTTLPTSVSKTDILVFVIKSAETGNVSIDYKMPDMPQCYELLAVIKVPNDYGLGDSILTFLQEAFWRTRSEIPEDKIGRVLMNLLADTFVAGVKWGQANPKADLT